MSPALVLSRNAGGAAYWCFPPQHRAFSWLRPQAHRPAQATSADQAAQHRQRTASTLGYAMAAEIPRDKSVAVQNHDVPEVGKAGAWNTAGHAQKGYVLAGPISRAGSAPPPAIYQTHPTPANIHQEAASESDEVHEASDGPKNRRREIGKKAKTDFHGI